MPQKKKTKDKNATDAARKTGNSEQQPQADVGTGPDSTDGGE